MGTALEMAVMAISMKAVCIMWGVYSDWSVPKRKGGWMTRVTPVKTRQRVNSSKRPQASLRKIQERRDTQTGLMEAIIVTSAMGRYLKIDTQCIRSNGPDGIGPASNIDSSCNGSDDEEESGAFWERVLSIHQHQGSVL